MLDGLDQRIIQELQDDARRSNVSLAKRLGVAESTIRNRLKKLFNNNVIKIVAVPDPYKFGYGCLSIVGLHVKLSELKQIEERLAKNPQVYFLASITGRFDLIMILVLRTPQELSNFMRNKVFSDPGISRSETFVCMEISKSPWTEAIQITKLIADFEAVE